jgi:hypothetical protein
VRTRILAVLLVIAAPLAAHSQTTAVMGVGGSAPADLREEIGEMLFNAAENNPGIDVMDMRDQGLEDTLEFLGCSTASMACLIELADTVMVERVLCASVSGEGADAEVSVWYYDTVASVYLMDQTSPIGTRGDRTALDLHVAAAVSNLIVLRVTSDREAVEMFVDDIPLGEAPVVSFDLAPGTHVISAVCDDCEASSRTIDVELGTYYSENLTPLAVRVARHEDGDAPASDDHETDGDDLLPTITTALGVALLGTGVAFGFTTLSTQEEFNATLVEDRARELADTGESQAMMTNIFIVSGIVVTGAGIVLMMTEEPTTPWIDADSAGLIVSGRF